MIQKPYKKYWFYGFVLLNVVVVVYLYFSDYKIEPKMLKSLLNTEYFLTSYAVYILVLIIRGLTLLPGTAFLLAGIYFFSFAQVFFAVQIAIASYCVIIHSFAHKLDFKIPQKILDYEHKVKTKEIPIIFALCFIPGISINVLVYFLSIIDVKLKNILIGIITGTSITSLIYIALITGVYESADYVFN